MGGEGRGVRVWCVGMILAEGRRILRAWRELCGRVSERLLAWGSAGGW